MKSPFTDKRVTIVGLGRSAAGAARLLQTVGAHPFVSDAGGSGAMQPWREQLDALGVPYETGGHTARALEECEALVMSPGVPPGAPAFADALLRGVPMISELELGFLHTTARCIAVTGTNGKTTTTELLRAMIAACGEDVVLAGNNAYPMSLAAVERPGARYAVLEVSSYQLERCRAFHPWLAAVLNLTPDHLGRHGTMEGYGAVKARIFAQQGAGDCAVVSEDDAYTVGLASPAGARRLTFSLHREVADGLWSDGNGIFEGRARVALVRDVPLPGKHNLANVLAALTLMRAGGFDWERTIRGLRAFRAVEHRIEFVAEIDGVRYYNDSKSTNIDSLRVALESFPGSIVLIAGGRGKGSDYGVLMPLVQSRVKTLITLGEDAPLLEEAFGPAVPAQRAHSMRDAVARARAAAGERDVVLLSPGCASFDMYNNFEERGHDFKACVSALAGHPVEIQS
jgi:UDP-N-acetylmuramoylalanine--D-glutamate ligase